MHSGNRRPLHDRPLAVEILNAANEFDSRKRRVENRQPFGPYAAAILGHCRKVGFVATAIESVDFQANGYRRRFRVAAEHHGGERLQQPVARCGRQVGELRTDSGESQVRFACGAEFQVLLPLAALRITIR